MAIKHFTAVLFLTAGVLSGDIITAGHGFTTDPITITANNVNAYETTTIKVLLDSIIVVTPQIYFSVPGCNNIPGCYSDMTAVYSFDGYQDEYVVDDCTAGCNGLSFHDFTYAHGGSSSLSPGNYDLVQQLRAFTTYLPDGYPGVYTPSFTISVFVQSGQIVLLNAAPEPGSIALLGSGVLGLWFTARRRRRAARR